MKNPISKSGIRLAFATAALAVVTLVNTGCATVMRDIISPTADNNKIVLACIMPGSAHRYGMQSALGDRMTTEGGQREVSVQAIIDNGRGFVQAQYTSVPYQTWRPNKSGYYAGLSVGTPVAMPGLNSGSYRPPSFDDLTGTPLHRPLYPLADAAQLTQRFIDYPETRPTSTCPPTFPQFGLQ